MINVVYLITDTVNDLRYIGSKMDYYEGLYYGSPSAKIGNSNFVNQQLYLDTVKNYPDKIKFDILERCDDCNRKELLAKETYWQKEFNAVYGSSFINASYANAKGRPVLPITVVHKDTREVRNFDSMSSCTDVMGLNNLTKALNGKKFHTSGFMVFEQESFTMDIFEARLSEYKVHMQKIADDKAKRYSVSRRVYNTVTGEVKFLPNVRAMHKFLKGKKDWTKNNYGKD